MLTCGVLYNLILGLSTTQYLNYIQWIIIVFFLFQTPKDFRRLLLFIDPSLNTPITEQSYGDHCAIYDENNPEDPYHNIKGNYRLFYGYYTPWLRLVSFYLYENDFISMASNGPIRELKWPPSESSFWCNCIWDKFSWLSANQIVVCPYKQMFNCNPRDLLSYRGSIESKQCDQNRINALRGSTLDHFRCSFHTF